MFRTLFASLALFVLIGCGGPAEFVLQGTERSAGTDGLLTVEEIEGNQMVTVELEHLPPPSRISESATVYLVWIQAQWRHLPDCRPFGLRRGRAGRAACVQLRRYQQFTVVVTAEEAPEATAPSEIVVARQEVGG